CELAPDARPCARTLAPVAFGGRFRALLDALAATQAGMAVATLPDPTGVAALRRAAGDVTSCRAADGTTRPVAADDLLSIDLAPDRLPTPPCSKVLNGAERAQVRSKVSEFKD